MRYTTKLAREMVDEARRLEMRASALRAAAAALNGRKPAAPLRPVGQRRVAAR